MDLWQLTGCPPARNVQGIDGLIVGELQRWGATEAQEHVQVMAAAAWAARLVRGWQSWCDAWDFEGLGTGRSDVESALLAGLSAVYIALSDARRAHERIAQAADAEATSLRRAW